MPRQARLDAPGVLQHVMARGIERRKIFWDDKDRSADKRIGFSQFHLETEKALMNPENPVNPVRDNNKSLAEKIIEDVLKELIEVVAGRLGLKPKLICSGSRQQKYSEARSLVAWLAIEETGHPAAEVARFLGISRVGVPTSPLNSFYRPLRSQFKPNSLD